MKKDKFGIIIAILLAPILLAGLVAFCRYEAKDAVKRNKGNGEYKYQDYTAQGKTLRDRGYVMRQQFPDGFRKLKELDIWEESYLDSEGEADVEGDEQILEDEQIAEEDITLEYMESGKLLDVNEFNVGKDTSAYEYLDIQLEFDVAKSCFTSTDKISQIEACGFTDFSKQLKKVVEVIRKHGGISYEGYYIFCQGVEFELFPTNVTENDMTNFWLRACLNASDYYVPEKYQEFIRNFTENGEYFLYSSGIGGETEVLVFCKNNSVAASGVDVKTSDEENDNKRIIFLFQDNNLVDYFVTTSGNDELVFDDADKQLIETYTKGLGKELSDRPAVLYGYEGYYRVYRTK